MHWNGRLLAPLSSLLTLIMLDNWLRASDGLTCSYFEWYQWEERCKGRPGYGFVCDKKGRQAGARQAVKPLS